MILERNVLRVESSISKKELENLIHSSSDEFKPPLCSRVNLKEYCQKLMAKASFFAIKQKGKIVGLIAFYCNDQIQKQAYLSYLYVIPDKRRQKIGRTLLQKAMLFAQKNGMESMKLETWYLNQAISLYRNVGFREKATIECEGVKKVLMVAALNSDIK